jgi:hypothetical protein
MKQLLRDCATDEKIETVGDIMTQKELLKEFGNALQKLEANLINPKKIITDNPNGDTKLLLDEQELKIQQIAGSRVTLFDETGIPDGDPKLIKSMIRKKLTINNKHWRL